MHLLIQIQNHRIFHITVPFLIVLILTACGSDPNEAFRLEEQQGIPDPFKTGAVEPVNTPYFTLTPMTEPAYSLEEGTEEQIKIAESTPRPTAFPPTPTPTLPPAPKFEMCTPLEGHTWSDLQEIVSFPYDPPPEGKDTGHHGVDFAYYRRGERMSIQGVSIQAVLPGRTAAVVLNRAPYGYMTLVESSSDTLPKALVKTLGIQEGESLYLLYAHMHDPPLPSVGQKVACGETLGFVGNTPPEWSSAPHLHFEARVGPAGVVFESMAFYSKTSTEEERANYTHWRMSGEFRLADPLALLALGLAEKE